MKQNMRPGKRICSKNVGAPVIQLDPDNNKAYISEGSGSFSFKTLEIAE